jgi:hypothetical protein
MVVNDPPDAWIAVGPAAFAIFYPGDARTRVVFRIVACGKLFRRGRDDNNEARSRAFSVIGPGVYTGFPKRHPVRQPGRPPLAAGQADEHERTNRGVSANPC